MSNILAITQKELKGYFASPIAYVVIGFYALIFGFFFYSLVLYFDRQSMQMVGLGAGTLATGGQCSAGPSATGASSVV